jgi:predicted nucleic acid-binding Zn ribbon protein
MNDDDPVPIARSLDRVRHELGMEDPRRLAELRDTWAEVVGEQLAIHARVASISNGVLVVDVDEGAWAAPLRYLEPEILERVGGAVERVQIRVRNHVSRPRGEPS